MPVAELTPATFASKLVCPPNKKQIQICDSTVRGLLIECRSAASSVPTWYWRYKDDGKTKYHRLGTLNDLDLEQARKQVKLLKAQHDLGAKLHPEQPQASEGITLDVFMQDHYVPYVRAHKRSAWRDEQLYRLRIAQKFGHLPLRQIARKDVQQFHRSLLSDGLSKASANHHAQLLRHALNLAVSWEMLERNVLKGIELFHLDNQVEHYLNDEQVDRLVEVLRTHENRTVSRIVLFLLATGARLREALCAEWSQVDAANEVWRIPATNSKSKKLKSLPLNASALWVIEQLDSREKSAFLFPSPVTGKPYTTITRAWYLIRVTAGLPNNIRLHDLRHTFASRLVSAGRSLFEVQTLLGHSDPRVSQRYAHLSLKRAQEASNAAAFKVG
jgi:integrase